MPHRPRPRGDTRYAIAARLRLAASTAVAMLSEINVLLSDYNSTRNKMFGMFLVRDSAQIKLAFSNPEPSLVPAAAARKLASHDAGAWMSSSHFFIGKHFPGHCYAEFLNFDIDTFGKLVTSARRSSSPL